MENIKIAKDLINTEIQALEDLRDSLDSSISKAIELLYATKGRIIITGIGKSGIIAKKIVSSMASTGSLAFFVHPSEASHGDLGMISTEDTVIAISNSGESKELVDILNYCKRFDITLISITKNEDSTLAKASDLVLKLPKSKEACPLGLAPTSSTTATLVLGDVLTVALMTKKHFTPADFNLRHPGGKLGSILLKIKDLMHTGDAMPLLNEKASMHETLLEMTTKRLGCVGFVDDNNVLVGIFTDGDLRRCLSKEILNSKASELMVKNPKTISENAFASEAIKIMNDKKITTLFVVDQEGKALGIVHIHDLIKNAVV